MVRQKSFTFGTKNAVVRRAPPPIPSAKSPSTNGNGPIPRFESAPGSVSHPLAHSVEQPRPTSPTKTTSPGGRTPVGRSISVVRPPLFGAAARAFNAPPLPASTSPTNGGNKRMTTQLSTSVVSDEFQQMKEAAMGDLPNIQSKRPPPAPPTRSPSTSAIERPTSRPVEISATEPAAATDAAPTEVSAPAAPSPGNGPATSEATPAVLTASLVVVPVEAAPDAVAQPAPVAPGGQEHAVGTAAISETAAPAPIEVDKGESSTTTQDQASVPASPAATVPETREAGSLDSTASATTESAEQPASAEGSTATKDKRKRKKEKSKRDLREDAAAASPAVTEETPEKKDKKQKKKRAKGSEQQEEDGASPAKPKRSKSQRLSKSPGTIEKPPTEEPASPAPELSRKKSKRSKKNLEVEISSPASAVTASPAADSPTKKTRAKSQRLSVDPKLVLEAENGAASGATPDAGEVKPKRSKKDREKDSSAPVSPRGKVSKTPSAEPTDARSIKKVSSQASEDSGKKPTVEAAAPVEEPPKPNLDIGTTVMTTDPAEEPATTTSSLKKEGRKKSARLSVMLKLPGEENPASPSETPKKDISNRKKRNNRRRVVRSLTSPLDGSEVPDGFDSSSGGEDNSDAEPVLPLSARDSNRTGVNATSDTESEVDAIKERLAPRRNRSRSDRRGGRQMPQPSSSSSETDSDSDGDMPIRRPAPSDEPPSRAILSHAHVVDDTDLTTDFEPDGRIHVVIKRRGRPATGPTQPAVLLPQANPRPVGSESEASVTPKPVLDAIESDEEMDFAEPGVSAVSVDAHRKKKRRGSAKSVPLANRNSVAKLTIAAGLSDVNFWAEPPTTNKNVIVEDEGKMFAYSQGKEMARKGGQGLAIKAASFNKLVEHLTWPDYNEDDKIFQRIFLSTLDYFTTPAHLLRKLAQRFDVPAPKKGGDPLTFEAMVKAPIQQRVCSVLKFWLEHFASEFSDTLVVQVREFINSQLSEKDNKRIFDIITNALNDLIEQQRGISERLRPPSVDKKSTSKRDLMRKTQSESTLMFFPTQKVCHPIELVQNDEAAKQITAIDWKIWSAIRPWEILKAVLNDNTYNASSSPLKELVARFNQISNFVISAILAQKTVKERARLVSKFIKIAKELRTLNNFNSLMAISAGINHTCVARLSQTMAQVPRKDLKTLNRLDRLMSVKKNWKRYRDALSEASGPCIPYLFVFALTFSNTVI